MSTGTSTEIGFRRTIRRSTRLVLLALLALFALPALGQDWRFLELRLTPGRAGHSFSLLGPDGNGQTPTAVLDGLIESGGAADSFARVQAWVDAEQPFTLIDDSAGDRLELTGPWAGALDLRGTHWFLAPDENGASSPSGRQYFLVGAERASHSFLVAQGGGFMVPTRGATVSVAGSAPPQYRFELSSVFSLASAHWLVDLTTNERSPSGRLNVAGAAWTPNTVPVPAGQVWLFLDPAQVGQSFTLHSRAAGGVVHQQVLTATALGCTSGSWPNGSMDDDFLYTWDHLGQPLTIPDGAGVLSGSVGLGMEFWLTRHGDGAASAPMFLNALGGMRGSSPFHRRRLLPGCASMSASP